MIKMSNATARKYLLHAVDTDAETDSPACFFAQARDGDEENWGFWVDKNGRVDCDSTSSSGEMPSSRIVDACVRAAVKHLNRKPAYSC